MNHNFVVFYGGYDLGCSKFRKSQVFECWLWKVFYEKCITVWTYISHLRIDHAKIFGLFHNSEKLPNLW